MLPEYHNMLARLKASEGQSIITVTQYKIHNGSANWPQNIMSAKQNIYLEQWRHYLNSFRGGGLFGKLNMAASNNSTNAAYLSALRSSFYRIIHLIDDCSRDAAALEYALFRVDVYIKIYNDLMCYCRKEMPFWIVWTTCVRF